MTPASISGRRRVVVDQIDHYPPEDVATYLNAVPGVRRRPRLLMKARGNIAPAQGGISALARRTEVDRVALSHGCWGPGPLIGDGDEDHLDLRARYCGSTRGSSGAE